MNAFKDNLKELRISRELSQAELASQIGISKSTISMYEVGNREPDYKTINLIANFFNVSSDYLLWGRTNTSSTSIQLNKLFGMLITQCREKRNASLEEVANSLKIDSYNLKQWEDGSGQIDNPSYRKICRKYLLSAGRGYYYYISSEFGERIKQGRIKAKYSLEIVAEYFDTSIDIVERWEQGHCILGQWDCHRLCNWYDLQIPESFVLPSNAQDLYKIIYNAPTSSEFENTLLSILNSLTDAGKKKVLDYAEDLSSNPLYQLPPSDSV